MQVIHCGLGTLRARPLPGRRNAQSWLRLGIARFRWCVATSEMAACSGRIAQANWGFELARNDASITASKGRLNLRSPRLAIEARNHPALFNEGERPVVSPTNRSI